MLKTLVVAAAIGLGLAANSYADSAAPAIWENPEAGISRTGSYDEGAGNRQHSGFDTSQLRIPAGHMPPPGSCRLWHADRPAGHQPPPGDCGQLEKVVFEGVQLIRSLSKE